MAPDSRGNRPAGRGTARALGAAVLALALALVAAAGCGDDGRDLARPDPDQTTTSRGADTSSSGSATTAAFMQMSSPDFSEGSAIPTAHTCFGEDVSPTLTLTDVPMGTAEVAIVMRDLDADGFVHWVVSSIPAQGGGVTQGSVAPGAVEAANDFGTVGWRGPCPPSGTHRYLIQAYALVSPVGVTEGMAGDEAAEIIEGAETTGVAAISVTAAAQSAG